MVMSIRDKGESYSKVTSEQFEPILNFTDDDIKTNQQYSINDEPLFTKEPVHHENYLRVCFPDEREVIRLCDMVGEMDTSKESLASRIYLIICSGPDLEHINFDFDYVDSDEYSKSIENFSGVYSDVKRIQNKLKKHEETLEDDDLEIYFYFELPDMFYEFLKFKTPWFW